MIYGKIFILKGVIKLTKKKVPSADDAIKSFKDVMTRASLSNYYYVNSIILSKNNNSNNILVIPDKMIWDKLVEDEEWKKQKRKRKVASLIIHLSVSHLWVGCFLHPGTFFITHCKIFEIFSYFSQLKKQNHKVREDLL